MSLFAHTFVLLYFEFRFFIYYLSNYEGSKCPYNFDDLCTKFGIRKNLNYIYLN